MQVTPEVYRELDHSRAGRGAASSAGVGMGSSSAAASGAGPTAGVRASGAAAMQVSWVYGCYGVKLVGG